jgi:hypothetical protein
MQAGDDFRKQVLDVERLPTAVSGEEFPFAKECA